MERGHLMKKYLLIFLLCLLVSLFVSAHAYTASGITYDDFFARLEAALCGFGMSQEDIAFCDLYNSEDGLEVYTCKVNTGTLITTTFLHTGELEKVEWTFPYNDLDHRMRETSAVISSFYTDSALNTRMENADAFMNDLAAAFSAPTGTTAAWDICNYAVTLDFGINGITYTFALFE